MTKTMTIQQTDTHVGRSSTLDGWDASEITKRALTLDGQPLGHEPQIGERFRLSFNRPEIECVVICLTNNG